MKALTHFINEDKIPGGKSDNAPDSDFDAEELAKGIKVELEHTDDKELAKEIAKDHLSEFPDYYTRLIDMEKDAEQDDSIEIEVDLDIPDEDDIEDLDESELNERKVRFTKKMKNSAKVVRETTEELFGKEGSARPLADKVFKIFKRELRIKAKELGVSLGQVRTWKIVLRDIDNPKVNTNISGKKQD